MSELDMEIEKDPLAAARPSLAPGQLEEAIPASDTSSKDQIVDLSVSSYWSKSKLWTHVILVSVLALITNMGPTMCIPGSAEIATDFGITSPSVSTLTITIYVLGLAVGPMFSSPMGEVYGRLPVYHIMNVVFLAFIVGSALSKNTAQFMIFRFLSGCAGGTPMALGGGTIADVTTLETRPMAMALFSLGPLTGPVLGPLIGGFVAGAKGWRWTFWILAILGGAASVASALLMRETNVKGRLFSFPTGQLPKATAASTATTTATATPTSSPLRPSRIVLQALVRPTLLLLRSPILMAMSLYVALVFGLMYLLFTTFTTVFEGQYGFTTATSGLVYLGLGVALVAAMVIFKGLGERVQRSRMRAEGLQRPRPEHRLILMICFSPLVGVGLFLYGWTAEYKVHWIVPIIGTVFIGFGAFFVIMPTQLYLVDLFGSKAAASALAANNLLRFLSSTFLPLAGPSMYKTMGYGWGNSLLGFLALAFVSAPILFYRYGERLRSRTSADLV